jgi:hypothetical protein
MFPLIAHSACLRQGDNLGLMNIPKEQIELRKKAGKVKGKDVYHIKTRGGFHVMALSTGEVIGTGPHRVVARAVAQKFEPDVVWSELSKSDDFYPLETYEHYLPKYEEVTKQMQALQAQPKSE